MDKVALIHWKESAEKRIKQLEGMLQDMQMYLGEKCLIKDYEKWRVGLICSREASGQDEIMQATHETTKKAFDFDPIFEFCAQNRVEVIRESDHLYSCYINYQKGERPYSSGEIHPLTALVCGIRTYQKIGPNSD